MIDFQFVSPTKLYFGHKKEYEIGKILRSYGYHKILMVYGQGSIKKTGLYDIVTKSLQENSIDYLELSGIPANPDVTFVRQGVALIKKEPVDAILAVGGGSVIDVAKSIGDSYYYDGDPLDFNLGKAAPTACLPIGVILTIAAAGSETSPSCVISDYTTGFKKGFNSDLHRCKFAIEDPELLMTLPPYQMGAGIIDIMMHSMERYFDAPSDNNQLCDAFALALCHNVYVAAMNWVKDPKDYDTLAQIMLASSLSHNDLTNLGKEKAPWQVHPLEMAISGYNPKITHGAGCGVVYLGWAKYIYQKEVDRFASFARAVFTLSEPNDEKAAIIGITEMERFYRHLGMPVRLGELGVTSKDLPSIVKLASGNGTRVIGNYPQSLEAKDMEAIYRLCL